MTNIRATDLASKCSQRFVAATNTEDATAMRCTSDIIFPEFKTLCGTMDCSNRKATTVEEYMGSMAKIVAHHSLREMRRPCESR